MRLGAPLKLSGVCGYTDHPLRAIHSEMRLNYAISVCFLSLLLLTCEMAEDINLITFFDCFNSTTVEKMEKCDFLAQLGAEVARDTINIDPSRKNVTFYPVEIQSSISTEVRVDQ